MRFGAPKTKREKALMEHIGPAYGAALESGVPSLVAQLEDAVPRDDAGRARSPRWPRRDRTGRSPASPRWC